MSVEDTIKNLSEEIRNKVGVKEVTFGASADTKVSIRDYETAGVWGNLSMTFNLDGFTGELPVDEIVNNIVIPIRNSFTKFAHPETMARIEELRAVIEGIRDGRTNAQIEARVNEVRGAFLDTFAHTFEIKK